MSKNTFHLKLPKVESQLERPLWSVIIPTHNCASFLKEALISVINQSLPEDKMEIIVVDDHSTKDNPEAVVDEIGNNRVKFIRQSKNVGKVKNYETGLLNSKGKFIHLLHGDDKVMNGFYDDIERIFNTNVAAKAAFCRSIYIDNKSRWTGMTGMVDEHEGVVEDIVEQLYVQQKIQTPSMVVKREVYENLGAFDRRLNAMEDWEMWIRIANSYPIAISNKVLAQYRSHESNATNLTFNDGSAIKTHRMVCDIIDAYIPSNIKKTYSKLRNQKQAEFLMLSYKSRKAQLKSNERLAFIKSIFMLHPSFSNLLRLLR